MKKARILAGVMDEVREARRAGRSIDRRRRGFCVCSSRRWAMMTGGASIAQDNTPNQICAVGYELCVDAENGRQRTFHFVRECNLRLEPAHGCVHQFAEDGRSARRAGRMQRFCCIGLALVAPRQIVAAKEARAHRLDSSSIRALSGSLRLSLLLLRRLPDASLDQYIGGLRSMLTTCGLTGSWDAAKCRGAAGRLGT